MPVPLYRYSFREAKDHDEIQDWKQSHAENIRCRDAIDKMVSERYSNNIMPNNIIKDACAEFGIDRVGWVLATTVSENSNDGRYRPDTRRWSMQAFYIPNDSRNHEIELRTHPELVNGMVGQYRKYLSEELGILSKEACLPNSNGEDYTEKLLILSRFGDKEAVTLHMYTRFVDGLEQRKILQNASRKNKMLANSNDLEDSVMGEGNLYDVVELMNDLRKNREPLLHCAVFVELSANSLEKLKELQADISMEMTREKLSVDRLTLRQKEGFIACMPCGSNIFGTQFERVLPSSAVANCYPFNYSGKTDPHGFYIGRDKFGTNIIVDFDRRSDDKTNSNILILGNSGQGKSYLLKLILVNTRMSGKSVISLDAEQEYKDLTNNLGGCYVDLMSGQYIINPLEPKEWSDNADDVDDDAPEAFRKATRLSQHISYLKDFFRVYKDFNDAQIDALEILLTRLYGKFGIHDNTDYDKLKTTDYPIMADLYSIVEDEYMKYEKGTKSLFTEDLLRELCLGLNSMCVGAESKFFNGHTNISDDKFICFGVKGLMEANKKLKDAMLFNILSYMNHKLLTRGHTAASIDELYLFLTNLTAIEYIRNASKRVRKKESSIILASQNIEDFLLPEIKEFTKPLFSIPTHQFLFNGGNINARDYRQIGRFPILKQDKHVRKRPEFTAPGNAGRTISRGFEAISRGFAKYPQGANVSHFKNLRAQTFWGVFRNSLIFSERIFS